MHLRVIVPVVGEELVETVRAEVESWVLPSTTVSVVPLARGTASIESAYDEALAGPGILDRVEACVTDGVDAVFVTCFGDPAVHAARELIDVPVVGGFEPAMLTAMSLGDHIGIVTVLPNVIPTIRSLVRRYAVNDRLGTIRVVDIPVLGLEDREVLLDRLELQALSAVQEGEADVIVLGCTGMLGVAEELRARIAVHGVAVPVVDPTAAAVTWLESAVRMGLSSSRTTYMRPPAKFRNA